MQTHRQGVAVTRRLQTVAITGLLGRFDHEFDFPEDWEFLILHGPNGVGKTRLLEILYNTFAFRTDTLRGLPFQQAQFAFSDRTRLEVSRLGQPLLPLTPDSSEESLVLTYHLHGAGVDIPWTPTPDVAVTNRLLRDIDRFLPAERIGPDLWLDVPSGEHVSPGELLDRYRHELPRGVNFEEPPTALRDYLQQSEVHLIETQRLLTFGPESRQPRRPSRRATVLQFSDDLTRRIREALALNSRTSQELDRTFPRRVLTSPIPSNVTDDQIRVRYQSQSKLRDELARISVLDPSGDMPLPNRTLHDWERRVLWTYLEDSERKLSTFQTLLDRVQLLRDIVNSRFLFKELEIHPDAGFRFITDSGAEIAPSQLSSGEQHELVLLYDLLFNVQPNSLVLVDEPEISLHITWQQQFLNDMQRIASLADLRFIVATHSPQIIHTWWDRAVSLYREPSDRRSRRPALDDDTTASRDA